MTGLGAEAKRIKPDELEPKDERRTPQPEIIEGPKAVRPQVA